MPAPECRRSRQPPPSDCPRRPPPRGYEVRPICACGRTAPLHRDANAVKRDVQIVRARAARRRRSAQPRAATGLSHLNVVLGVEWERVPHDDAAAGSDRHPLELRVLRQIASHPIHDAIETDGRIAHGNAADLRGRRDVALDECRGDTKHVRDVVEAGRRIVGRQQCADIDVERKEIADGVAVLGAVQTVERRGARIQSACGRRVERGFETGRERLPSRRGGLRSAVRRHGSRAQLAHDLLPHLGVTVDVQQVDRIESETAGVCPRVMTGETVLLDESRIGRCSRARRRGGCLLTTRHRDAGGDEDCSDARQQPVHRSLASRLISAIVDGLATGEFVARKTPSAHA